MAIDETRYQKMINLVRQLDNRVIELEVRAGIRRPDPMAEQDTWLIENITSESTASGVLDNFTAVFGWRPTLKKLGRRYGKVCAQRGVTPQLAHQYITEAYQAELDRL